MIELHYWPTPNSYKILLMLEEAEIPFTEHPVDITKGEQFTPDFLKISPNNRMPAIVDTRPTDQGTPLAIFESGAILLYLAEKYGKFGGRDPREKADIAQWLMWQMSALGPMSGQNFHFVEYAPEPVPYAIDRYSREVGRLYGVLDRQLADRAFIAGGYSIADMACYPWIAIHAGLKQSLDDFPNLARWYAAIRDRPATVRAYERGAALAGERGPMTDEERAVLFGQDAATVKR